MHPVDPLSVSHRKAEALLATGAPVFLTVNPVEYHGPHLSLHNDRLVSRGFCDRIHRELVKNHPEWPFLLAQDLEIGAEPTKGRGSRAIDFVTERRLILEAVNGLAELGATRVVIMTFHGGPMHGLAIDAGVRALEARGVRAIAPLSLVLDKLLALTDPSEFADCYAPIADEAARARGLAGIREDIHAGYFETAIALALAGDSVDPGYVDLPECPPYDADPWLVLASKVAAAFGRHSVAREIALGASASSWGKLDPFPGYTGAPHLATVEAGEAYVAHAMRLFIPVIEAVLAGERPAPPAPFGFMRGLTLGGRVAPASTFARTA